MSARYEVAESTIGDELDFDPDEPIAIHGGDADEEITDEGEEDEDNDAPETEDEANGEL